MFIKGYKSCAVVLLVWFATFLSGQGCIYDPDNDFFTHEGETISRGRQVIVPSLSFTCHGRLRHISYVTVNGSDPGGDSPVFQIWRPTSVGSSVYYRVAQTQFLYENLIQDTTSFYFTDGIITTENHQIDIQPGDVIGYYQPYNPHRLIWSISESKYTSYSNNASIPSTTFNTSNADYVNMELIPYKNIEKGFDIRCDNLSIPTNGAIISCSSGRIGVGFEGDTCNFTCNTGYELTGNDSRTCQSDGTWSGTESTCSEKVCPPLNNLYNGKLNCSFGEVAHYEDMCNFTCNTGYELTGSDSRTCQSDGNWSGTETTCSEIACPSLNNLYNGKLDCSFGEVAHYEDICSFSCNTGYELIGNDSRICQSDGTWSGTETTCSEIVCPPLNNPYNGKLNCSFGKIAHYEDICSFSCNTGYEITGNVKRTCQNDGNWSGNEVMCKEVSCPELDYPENGIVLCPLKEDKKYLYEDFCKFTCNTGYELVGSDTRSCKSDGSWSGTQPICEKGMLTSVTGGDGLESETRGSDSGSGSSGAAIGGVIGGVITIIAIIIIIVLLIICYTRRDRKRKTHPPDGRILPNGADLTGVNNPLYGEYTMTGLSKSDYEDPDLPDYSAMGATLKTQQYELPTSLVDKAATPSPSNTAPRTKQNVYSTPYKDEGNYGPLYHEPSSDEQKIYEHFEGKMFRKLNHDEIRSFEELGVGEFGVVTRCMWKQSADKELEVAVKTLNINASDKDRLRFLQEAAIMCQFDHPNVIRLYGVVTETPIMIVLEYMPRGNLRNFLMQMRHLNGAGMMPLTLLKYCNEVVAGMVYLSSKQFVHRDLAARNILMSEDFTCKIADFGMSRDLIDHNYYVTSGGKIPVKWTAPEALHYRKYSLQSDVWSYGCVLYEIWSLGYKPFEELTNTEALQKVDRGYRLPPPPGCSRTIYQLMIDCWNPDPKLRPQFCQIAELLASDSECLLSWSDEDRQFGGQNAMKLGAPLDNGNNLYYNLQMQYRQ